MNLQKNNLFHHLDRQNNTCETILEIIPKYQTTRTKTILEIIPKYQTTRTKTILEIIPKYQTTRTKTIRNNTKMSDNTNQNN
jgi:DNA-binding transcriptional regulator YbjK